LRCGPPAAALLGMEGALSSMAAGKLEGVLRTPTFYVESERQRSTLETFQRREELIKEEIHKNKVLCFQAKEYQKQHPDKAKRKIRDADVTMESPMILGVADGVSQIEDFGIDASELPKELLNQCLHLGAAKLDPSASSTYLPQDRYRGPIPLLREAFELTESFGSTTAVLALLDNSTKIHGKPHPMIAVITVGDCQLIMLRRQGGRQSSFEEVFTTEMQRIEGHVQTPLQIARIGEDIDPNFHDGVTVEVIEKGSAVHCVSAYEGDMVVMGSDGVFDNLFPSEVKDICEKILPPGSPLPTPDEKLRELAETIVLAAHEKTYLDPHGRTQNTPIGRGGKVDDTAVVVAEVVEWTEERARRWRQRSPIQPSCGFWQWCECPGHCEAEETIVVEDESD